jgi:site-specific recombinase XerC
MTHTDVSASLNFPIREEEYVDLQHPRLPVVMQALLGHAHIDTTARYIHLAPAHVKAEFDAARDRQRSRG